MKDIAYYNGKIGRIDEVQAPITDRGFYFGDGVYDAAMVNNKKIFELEGLSGLLLQQPEAAPH